MGFWETTDFTYAEYKGNRIYADSCQVYKEAGIMFYKGNNLISYIDMKIEDVSLICISGERKHIYIKPEKYDSAVYLHLSNEIQNSFVPGDKVILRDKIEGRSDYDFVWATTIACSQDVHFLDKMNEQIEKDLIWFVKDNLENRILLVEKDGVLRYVKPDYAATLDTIKSQAEVWSSYKD